jgi:hypothetical protein
VSYRPIQLQMFCINMKTNTISFKNPAYQGGGG